VIHYTDRVKPWHAEGHNPLDGRWYEMLDGTAWGHWRPDDRTRPLYRRVGSRTKSAWRVLTAGGSVIEAT
jgi:lipopolysaccharide biosynthesis glycosyltransferase